MPQPVSPQGLSGVHVSGASAPGAQARSDRVPAFGSERGGQQRRGPGPCINDSPRFGLAPSGARPASVADARSPRCLGWKRHAAPARPVRSCWPVRRAVPPRRNGSGCRVRRSVATSCHNVFGPPGSVLSGTGPAGQQYPGVGRSAFRFRSASCRRSPCEREARTRSRARRPQGSRKVQPGRGLATGNVHLVSGNAARWSSQEADRFSPSGIVPVGSHAVPDPVLVARHLPDTGVHVTAPRGSS